MLLTFGSGRELLIKVGSPDALYRGAGLHRLTFPVDLDTRKTMGAGIPFTLSGQAWLGSYRSDWLGPLATEEPSVTYLHVFRARLVLAVTDDQLAVIEQRRAGADFQINVDVQVTLGYDPAVSDVGNPDERWPTRSSQEYLSVFKETWVRLLNQVDAGSSLAIVMPVPLGEGFAGSVGLHLREAIRKINLGEYGDAVTEARKAIDVMDATAGPRPSEATLVQTRGHDRTLEQRLHLLRHATYSLASPSAHGDANARTFKWTRESALAVVASVAALAACERPGPTTL